MEDDSFTNYQNGTTNDNLPLYTKESDESNDDEEDEDEDHELPEWLVDYS